ncbi:MAG: response regulator [archaeon]
MVDKDIEKKDKEQKTKANKEHKKKDKKKNVLLVEDNPGDILITKEAFDQAEIKADMSIAKDGEEAINFLSKVKKLEEGAKKPDLVLLDLNLPKVNGKEVLKIIKKDKKLKRIPVVILSSSDNKEDIKFTYDLQANCYVKKPSNMHHFITIAKSIGDFWLNKAISPKDAELEEDEGEDEEE